MTTVHLCRLRDPFGPRAGHGLARLDADGCATLQYPGELLIALHRLSFDDGSTGDFLVWPACEGDEGEYHLRPWTQPRAMRARSSGAEGGAEPGLEA